MIIDKAIEKLDDLIHARAAMAEQDTIDSIKLGREALKRLEDGRSKGYDYFGHLLLGETKEVKDGN